eukprot:TRINITY_DN17421_c0_g1_i1.p1 TRINITY_DN17421_c0_g1~~TRINITY_DN17421_c0_g1_i1.p1  ORF type:complete len:483 (+),score=112.70 TRINITY_DN17421_c0_g1_i1:198-1451(+)
MGAFGVVKKGVNKFTGGHVAIKVIRKTDCKPEELRSEVNLLRLVKGYPGIVSLENVYETNKDVSIVMEYISGGELFDAIVENEFYSEKDAADLIRQLTTTVEYVHSKHIVHRDLKPENLLFEKRGSSTLKLIDFGIATLLPESGQLYEVVGSRTYMAPEIDRRCGYGKPVDMYSVGVIMYILLCGYPPFDFDQGIYELAFGSPEWDDISSIAKDIIRNLLQEDGTKRYTAAELKVHPWISGKEAPQQILNNNIHNTIKHYIAFNQATAKVAGDRQNRRMSIYGLFNIARDTNVMKSPQVFPPSNSPVEAKKKFVITTPNNSSANLTPLEPENNPEVELIKGLKNKMWDHWKGFGKIKDIALQIIQSTRNETLKEQLMELVKEIDFLSNEYKGLLDTSTPKLRQAHQLAQSEFGQKKL